MAKKKQQVIRKNETFEIGDIVLAKIRGYAAWPAKIKKVTKIKIEVVFYGDKTTGSISPPNVSKFMHDSNVMDKHMKRKGYEKAVKEALIEMAQSEPTKTHHSTIENASADMRSKKCMHTPLRRSPRFARESEEIASTIGIATHAPLRRSRRLADRKLQKPSV